MQDAAHFVPCLLPYDAQESQDDCIQRAQAMCQAAYCLVIMSNMLQAIIVIEEQPAMTVVFCIVVECATSTLSAAWHVELPMRLV